MPELSHRNDSIDRQVGYISTAPPLKSSTMGDAAAADTRIDHHAALTYWNAITPDVAGMLGGYPQISRIDLRGSANFLAKLRRQHPSPSPPGRPLRAVDCGAGIGRITAGLLSKECAIVDVVEPVAKFAAAAAAAGATMAGTGRVGETFVVGLEEWKPAVRRYDLIWNQWCLGHLTDRQLVGYLQRCREGVTGTGWVFVKENMSTDGEGRDVFDEVDSSVTRTDGKFRDLFRQAGLRVVKTELQSGFPKGLYPVRFYALRPDGD